MANHSGSNELTKIILNIVSTFGLGAIFVVVVGRLWTIAYFEYFGLSTGDLEFGIEDFAFRSLEVLVSIGLAAIVIVIGWRAKRFTPGGGLRGAADLLLLEAVIAAIVGVGLFPGLDRVPNGLLVRTGVLGIFSGFGLSAMLLPAANVWFDADDETASPSRGGRSMRERVLENSPKAVAAVSMILILFVYVPFATQRLAYVEAQVDLEEGKLPVAILTTEDDPVDPLPGAIAASTDQTTSSLVRVILAQSQNTYVLDSTQCTTIGQARIVEQDGEKFVVDPDVCRVFAIPTARLKSIEYVSIAGTPPKNDSLSQAISVTEEEPLDDAVLTRGASDEALVECRTKDGVLTFHRTVWYQFTPSRQGALLVRASSSDPELVPLVGVWEIAPGGQQLSDEPARGSGAAGHACNAPMVSEGEPAVEKVAAATADVEPEMTYVIAVGSKGDRGGTIDAHIEFFPSVETTTVEQPNLQIAFYTIALEPRSRVQGALLAALDTNDIATRLNLDSSLTVVEDSYELDALALADSGASPREILEPIATTQELNILIVTPAEGTSEDRTILLNVASAMQIQMLNADLGISSIGVGIGEEAIHQCPSPCATVLVFREESDDESE